APGGPPGTGPGPQGGQPPGGQPPGGQPPREQGGGRGGFSGFGGGGGGGGRGGSDYSSPVLGDGKIYYVTRKGDIHVIKPTDKFEKLATNRLTSEPEDFSASPAISSGQIFFRSSKHLYCVSLQK
ncbi:MAG: PQQ-like beta-propeller repeat protein, partial [Fuerstia sp.]|nr:PQQ-like beta-propeller repeat protein [Fuerstiella sp.]